MDQQPELSASLPADVPAGEREPFVTCVTTDRRVISVSSDPEGALTILVEGRSNPLRFDRWQSLALANALALHADLH